MAETSIEWTQQPGTRGVTWNPVTGCDTISAGCDHCYARIMAKRLKGMGQANYQNDGDPVTSGPGFKVTMHLDALAKPLTWRTPRTVFVNSMSDLFHHEVTQGFIGSVWNQMAATPQHTYQILTKRPARARSLLNRWAKAAALHQSAADRATGVDPGWLWRRHDGRWCGPTPGPLSNVWLGTSVENGDVVDRVNQLRNTPAVVRFLSVEPFIGSLPEDLDLTGIDWVIIGGESGSGARPMNLTWVDDVIAQARAADVAVFVKQLGTVWARGEGGGKGNHWWTWPSQYRIREYPTTPTVVAA